MPSKVLMAAIHEMLMKMPRWRRRLRTPIHGRTKPYVMPRGFENVPIDKIEPPRHYEVAAE